jgi:hypothetical protein
VCEVVLEAVGVHIVAVAAAMRNHGVTLVFRARYRIDIGAVAEARNTAEVGALYGAVLQLDHGRTRMPPMEAAYLLRDAADLISRANWDSELRHGHCRDAM